MGNNSVCIFAESGEYVKFHNMLAITMASVANDMEVSIFFSYSALEKLKKEKINEMSFENSELKINSAMLLIQIKFRILNK